MHILVLHHLPWAPTQRMAGVIATELGCRAIAFDRRPDLGMYDVVVLVTPAVGPLDPALLLFAAGGQLRGKVLALVSDVGLPLAEQAFTPFALLASALGGARLYAEQLHVGVGLQENWSPAAREAVVDWAQRLRENFPTPAYPRGHAGKRIISQ